MGPFAKVAGAAALVILLAGAFAAGSSAAAPSGQAAGQVREEVTVALKLLQAYVTTKDGKPVTDLTPGDFEVTDNGQKVSVTHFERHVVGGDAIAPEAPLEGPRLSRKFFFFFDLAFTDPRSARKAREAALHFMDTAVRPGDEIGVLSYSPMRGLTIHEYLSTDHARIRGIVDAFGLRTVAGRAETLTSFLYADEVRWMENTDPLDAKASREAAFERFFTEQAQAQTRGVVDDGRRQGYTDQARQFAETFANLARAMRYVPGWKNLILFSSGISRALIYGSRRSATVPNMDANNPDQMMAELNAYDNAQSNTGVRTEFADALKELKNANSPIYAIDCTPTAGEMDINNPVGPSVNAREFAGKDSLIQLAGESGGKYFGNTVDYKDALAQVSDITGAFYVIGYTVPAAWDGAFHKIKVRVARPGCKVVSQNGYYNPKPYAEYSPFERLLQMTDLALSDNPATELPAELPMGLVPVVIGGWTNLVAFVGLPKDTAAGILGKKTDAYLLVIDEEQGKSAVKSFRLKPPEGGPWNILPVFAVPAKPGRYTCRIIIRNGETGRAARGSAGTSFSNPVPSAIGLDTPLLVREAAGWADLSAAPETMLSAIYGYDPAKYTPVTEALSSGPQTVLAALRLSLGAPAVELDYTATDILGDEKIEIPVTLLGSRQDKALRTCLVELTFGGLKPGPHTLVIKAKDKNGADANETKLGFLVK